LFANTKSWDDEESQETANFRYNFRNQRYQLLVRLKPQDLEQREFKIVQSYESRHGEIEAVSSTLALEMSREIETAEYQEAQSSQPLMQSATSSNDDGIILIINRFGKQFCCRDTFGYYGTGSRMIDGVEGRI